MRKILSTRSVTDRAYQRIKDTAMKNNELYNDSKKYFSKSGVESLKTATYNCSLPFLANLNR